MQKNLLALFLFLCFGAHLTTQAQTAVNFTANDCAGTSHQLFTELNAGKVVVMVWVMPCGSCSGAALTAYNVAQTFETSHPGKVLYYLVDDYGNTNCATLTNWANGDVASGLTVFSDASIAQSDYGTAGMPKVVVTGGANHTVFFNKNNSAANDAAGIESAINAAISEILDVPAVAAIDDAKWIWDASNNSGALHFTTATSGTLQFSLFNLLGQSVTRSENRTLASGSQVVGVNTNDLPRGTYFLRVHFNGGVSTFKIAVQ